MHIDSLISEFCDDILTITREEVLNAFREPRPEPRVLKAPKASRALKPRMAAAVKAEPSLPEPSPEPTAKSVYKPHVSSEIQAEVEAVLLSDYGHTSHEIADKIKRGETTVRTALKHLTQRGAARTETKGRAILFFQALP